MEWRRVVVYQGEEKTQTDRGRAIMKGSRRLRDKMKEIKLTDHSDITFNPLLIFSLLQLSDSSGDDQISCEGLGCCSEQGPDNNINNGKSSITIITLSRDKVLPLPPLVKALGLHCQCSLLLGALHNN